MARDLFNGGHDELDDASTASFQDEFEAKDDDREEFLDWTSCRSDKKLTLVYRVHPYNFLALYDTLLWLFKNIYGLSVFKV